MKPPYLIILVLLWALLSGSPAFSAADPEAPAASPAQRLAEIDALLLSKDWSRAEEASRREIDRSRLSLSSSGLAAAVARLALVEAGFGREAEAVWHWQVARSLDRNVLPEDRLRTFGAPGELLIRHPLRLAGQAPFDLDVSQGAGALPPRKAAGDLPEFSAALRSLSVPLWVRAQVIIDAEGRPRDPVILAASLPGMAFEVLDAVRSWRFEPARKEGQPVAAFYQLTLNPPAKKALAELAPLTSPDLAEIDSLLRTGRWKESQKKARKAWALQDSHQSRAVHRPRTTPSRPSQAQDAVRSAAALMTLEEVMEWGG